MGNEESKKSKVFKEKTTHLSEKERHFEQLFKKYAALHGTQQLNEGDFTSIFSLPSEAGDMLAAGMYNKYCGEDSRGVSERRFIEESQTLQRMLSEVEYFVSLFCDKQGNMNRAGCQQMCKTSCISAYIVNGLGADNVCNEESEKLFSSLCSSILPDAAQCKSAPEVVHFVNVNLPKLLAPIHTFVLDRLTGKQVAPSAGGVGEVCGSSRLLSPSLLWLLSSALPSVYTSDREANTSPTDQQPSTRHLPHWHKLYDGDQHGFSMNRFEHHCFSYRGPTIMLLSVGDEQLYCAACDVEWREHPKQWGGHHCVVYQILPEFRELEHGSNIFYYNIKSRNLTRGVQIGSEPRFPIIHIDSSMDGVTGKYMDSSTPRHLSAIEVWGCGSDQTLQEQGTQRRWERAEVDKARKVKNPGAWEENPDKFLLDIGGVKVEHNERADTCEVFGGQDPEPLSGQGE